MSKIPLIVIAGPTASGKTDASIALAKALNGEIVSADSMQIYKYMDIGTAKPTLEERQGINHYMIDIIDPRDSFSVAQYQKMAAQFIEDIYSKGRIPILTGGTGLYINSVVYPMSFTDATEDSSFRQYMNKLKEEKGNDYLHDLLKNCDPETAQKLHPNDSRRIIRALEVFHLTGKTMSEYSDDYNRSDIPYKLSMFGLTMDRQKLYERINKRADNMIRDGLLDEIKFLIEMGCKKESQSMQGLGYKEFFDYFEGKSKLDDCIELLKRDTRRYAKRQLTWFRRDERITWIDADIYDNKQNMVNWIIMQAKINLAL